MTEQVRRLSAAIADGAANAAVPGRWLRGVVQRIEVTIGSPRIYIVDSRPMVMVRTGEQDSISLGDEVIYWASDQPFLLGRVVSD